MVTASEECVLTKEGVEYLRSNALQNDLHALIHVFDHKSEAVEKLDGKTDSRHYAAAIKAVLGAAAEELKDKPQLAQDRLIAYTAACRKTIGTFLMDCAMVVNGETYQREPLTGTVSKSGKPLYRIVRAENDTVFPQVLLPGRGDERGGAELGEGGEPAAGAVCIRAGIGAQEKIV